MIHAIRESHRDARLTQQGRTIWLVLVGLVCVAIGGFFVANHLQRKDATTPAGDDSNPFAQPLFPDSAMTPEEKDRALREEQLSVGKRLAETFPDDADAIFLMGLVYQEQGDSRAAVDHWQRAVQLGRNDAEVFDKLGLAALLGEQFEAAAAHFRQALSIRPRKAEIRLHLAQALTSQGALREAVEVLEAGGRLPSEGYRMLGEAYQQLRDLPAARKNFEQAVSLRPDFAEAYYGLARVCARLKDADKARTYMEKFKALRAEDDTVGRHWRKTFDPLLVTRQSTAHTHTDVGRVYYRAGNAREAEELWRRAAVVDPQNTACRFQLARLYQQSKRPKDALAIYEALAIVEPENGAVTFNVGNLYLQLKQYLKAERAFRKTVSLAPKRPDGYVALVRLFLQTNSHLSEAKTLAHTVVRLQPIAPSYALLSQACEKSGDLEGAKAAIRRASQLDPRNVKYRQAYQKLQERK